MECRACREPVDSAKEGGFERDKEAFLPTPDDGGSLDFTLPDKGAGFLRVRGDLLFEAAFFFESALPGVETNGSG